MVAGAVGAVSPVGFVPGFPVVPRPGAGTLPSVFADGASATTDEELDGAVDVVGVVALATVVAAEGVGGSGARGEALASVVVGAIAAAAVFAR